LNVLLVTDNKLKDLSNLTECQLVTDDKLNKLKDLSNLTECQLVTDDKLKDLFNLI